MLQAAVEKPQQWETFIEALTSPILSSFKKPTSAMPTLQYEKQLISLNIFLNSPNAKMLLIDMKRLCGEDNIEDLLPRIVLSRLSFKLLDSILECEFKAMSATKENESRDLPHKLVDRECFEVHLRKLFQAFYVKGINSESTRMLLRCACIRRNFIDSESDADSVELICSNISWESGEIKLKERIVDIFVHVEGTIERFLSNKMSNSVMLDAVFDDLLDNRILLDYWCLLTTDTFREEESLIFLRDMVSNLIKLAVRLETNKLREIETQGKGKYALRTDLKRN